MSINKRLFFTFLSILLFSLRQEVNGQLSLPPSTITSNVPEASQYKVVYELNIPNNMTSLSYVQNLSGSSGVTFNRVAYYMELDGKWVWVSMNKYNSSLTLAQLGIPFGWSSIYFQQIVSGMNVLGSSNAGVSNANNISGNVEIWPHCYGTHTGLGGIGGNAGNYDHDDQINATNNCYGSFQVHNYIANQTIFAYNNFNGGTNDDLGIGNNTGNTNPDWTFMSNAASYTTKKLFILVDACNEISINTQPSSSNMNICQNGAGGTLSVSASTTSGSINNYKWYQNTTASYSGATLMQNSASANYTIPTNTSGTYYYFCVVGNTNGCARYSNISGFRNILANPSISSHPATTNQSRCLNSAATALSVVASAGSGSISSYQWFKSTANSNASGTSISGATSTSYTPPTNIVDSGYFYCLVTNSNACATKSNISGFLKVDAFVNKGTVSANQVVCHNTNASNVSITGNTGTIQWQSSINNSTWTNISGATNATLTAAQIGTISTTTFVRAQLTAGSCTDFSNTVSLEVNNALAFDGINDYVNLGDNIENFNNITTEAWVFWKGSTYPYSEILTKDLISSFSITSDNKLHANFGNGTIWGSGLNSATNIPLNTWTHLAITRLNGVVKLYINGVEDVNSTTINITGQNSVVRAIGAKINGTLVNSSAFNGHIDEIRVWNVARTAKEINDNEYRVLNGNESGLILYHQFNRGIPNGSNNSGFTTSLDKSTSGLNGTLIDFALSGTNSNYVSGNHSININNPDLNCGGQTLNVLSLSKVPNTYQWYRNTVNSNSSGTLISGASSDQFQTLSAINGNTFYYATTNSCSSATSNTVSISNPQVTGTLDVYEDNTTQLASVETPAVSSPWVSLNPSLFTTNSSGLITGIYPGTGNLVYTSSAGCKDTVSIVVHATEWNGSNSNDFTTGSNWKLNTKPNVIKKIRFNNTTTNNMILTSRMSVDSIDFGNSDKQIELGNHDLIVNHIRNFNTSKYIKTTGSGKVKKQLTNNASFTFPVGNKAYNPITITNKTGTADTFSINILDTAYLNGSSSGNINNPYVKRTWNISKNTASANSGSGVDLTFNWNANEVVGTLTNPTMNHHNGSGWEIPTMGTSSVSGNSLNYTGYKGTFSPFAIGGSTNVALPVELKSFNAVCSSDHVQIEWTTASEKNNDRFELYKSLDAKTWTKVYTVKGQGTKATETNYRFFDFERQSNYYRLNDIDFNGKISESNIIVSSCKDEIESTSISPNPASDYIMISTPCKENTMLRIITLNGVVLKEEQLISSKSYVSVKDLKSGIYLIEIEKKGSMERLKLFKQ
jgi:hypothetical protein